MTVPFSDLETQARKLCPHCFAGIAVRQRIDSREFVHDSFAGPRGVQKGHTICQANGLRQDFEHGR